MTQAVRAVLRGGPSHGLKVTAVPEPQGGTLDLVSVAGYVYRDSGQVHQGLHIYDWLPANPRSVVREVPRAR